MAQQETQVAPRPIDRTESSKPSVLIGILFVIIFLAVPCAIFFTYQRLAMDTSYTEQSDREEASAQLDEATPVMLSDAWDKYSTVALGPPTKPGFYYVEQFRRRSEWKIAIASGIALVAATLAAAVAVSRNVAREKR